MAACVASYFGLCVCVLFKGGGDGAVVFVVFIGGGFPDDNGVGGSDGDSGVDDFVVVALLT